MSASSDFINQKEVFEGFCCLSAGYCNVLDSVFNFYFT